MSDSPTPPTSPPPLIPRAAVPYVQLAASILLLVSADLALPGPWTPDRYFSVAAAILSCVLGGALPGNGKRE